MTAEWTTLDCNSVVDGQHPYRWLFNTDRFLGLRDAKAEYQDLTFDGVKLGDVAVVDGVNGWRAPFGGIDWRRQYWGPEMIHGAIAAHDFGELREIRGKPMVITAQEAPATNALLAAGWMIAGAELDYLIPVQTADVWAATLPRQTIHSVNRACDAGVSHAFAMTDEAWRECYELLAANRAFKGRVLSLDLDYVLALREELGDLARMHAMFDADERLVAAALVYRVAREIDVVQWHGDLPNHGLGYSVMPATVSAYIHDAELTGASFVDLGISSVDGKPDGGLCRFKRSVGAMACQRLVLRR